ncbi:LacI family DNA-binding transcriptional regulator [Microbacterium sp. CJ88]|uniref:LacI family DNA-binding transcriptional regulator n=1 Tax=Microbacterium sp. CJ88 TaxID=3445672 RepID=UPI003F65B29A
MAGIDEVAKAAGVSTATVSRALSGRGHVSPRTRERVLAVAAALGYVVSASASSLASGRARNIGVLVPHVDRWFFSTVLGGIADELARAGFDLTLYSVSDDPDQRLRVFETFLRRQRVDGVIAVSIALGRAETERLVGLGLPLVAVGGAQEGMTSLAVDDVAVGRAAAEHLLALGHRDIAHIGARPENDRDFRIPSQRRRGIEDAMTDAGASLSPARFAPADFTIDGGHRAAGRLLSGTPSTAIIAASDEMAIGAVLAARELGRRVPEDVSVIGVDGHEMGAFFRLTTIDQFPSGQGRRAASVMLALLDGVGPPTPAPLPFSLVVRATTAPPPR